jgi:hypothetical protein
MRIAANRQRQNRAREEEQQVLMALQGLAQTEPHLKLMGCSLAEVAACYLI